MAKQGSQNVLGYNEERTRRYLLPASKDVLTLVEGESGT